VNDREKMMIIGMAVDATYCRGLKGQECKRIIDRYFSAFTICSSYSEIFF
jgi:hypothetical protein